MLPKAKKFSPIDVTGMYFIYHCERDIHDQVCEEIAKNAGATEGRYAYAAGYGLLNEVENGLVICDYSYTGNFRANMNIVPDAFKVKEYPYSNHEDELLGIDSYMHSDYMKLPKGVMLHINYPEFSGAKRVWQEIQSANQATPWRTRLWNIIYPWSKLNPLLIIASETLTDDLNILCILRNKKDAKRLTNWLESVTQIKPFLIKQLEFLGNSTLFRPIIDSVEVEPD